MSYATAVEHLYALSGELAPPKLGAPRRKFDLDHMRTLASALGNPQQQFSSVLIAGTNGKGSTAATLASILSTSGYRVGLYTSPHLVRVNERVQLAVGSAGANSLAEIDDDTFTRLYFQVDDAASRLVAEGKLPQPPSFFEVMTALAFLAFAEAKVDIAVLEVGIGGRLDATNIVDPIGSVITDISLDHMEWLGNTITEIAQEKAGILRPDGVLVTLPQHPEANLAVGEIAVANNVTGLNAADYLPTRGTRDGRYDISFAGEPVCVETPLSGEHQRRNVALAVATAWYLHSERGFDCITPALLASGIRQTRWAGRLERHTLANGTVLLMDVAHNPAGAWTLRSYLSQAFRDGTLPSPRTLLFSALRDKSVGEMAQILFPLFEEEGGSILAAPINSPRAASLEQLEAIGVEQQMAVLLFGSVSQAMEHAIAGSGSVVVSGSVYLVGEVKTWLAARHEAAVEQA